MKTKTPVKKKTKKVAKKVVGEIVDHDPANHAEDSSDESSETVVKGLTSTDPVSMYLAEIRKYPLLSREEEQVLAKKYFACWRARRRRA